MPSLQLPACTRVACVQPLVKGSLAQLAEMTGDIYASLLGHDYKHGALNSEKSGLGQSRPRSSRPEVHIPYSASPFLAFVVLWA
ncbi:hypothetical protein BV20DRAFT_547648 [Pilatotrama ljubarskyi]|nr:hypothetical protein BV20DRAFT_547648 [Pilatotrama ljubarskyi]